MSHVEIYTDGGASPNPGSGGWGALLIADSGVVKELSGNEHNTTNNRMELMAAIRGLQALKKPGTVVDVYTDSKYLREGITAWLPIWEKNGWRTSNKKPVKNQDLWQELAAECKRHTITWHWVAGHTGHVHNEHADRLATAARERLLPG